MFILFFLLTILGAFIFSAIVVNFKYWKYYKTIYKELPNKKWYKNKTQIYVYDNQFPNKPNFIWFIKDNHFCIDNDNWIYLHDRIVTWCDPYSLYWLIKYKRWFKKNVNINTIENYLLCHI